MNAGSAGSARDESDRGTPAGATQRRSTTCRRSGRRDLGGQELRGDAFKRTRACVADVFGELSEDDDGTAIGRPGERSRR